MSDKKRTTISTVIVLVFGFILFYIGTDGFQAYTAETVRTNALIENSPKFPEVTLEDSKKRTYPFSEFEGKYVFITFIYTACSDVCPQLEVNVAEVYKNIPENLLEKISYF